jgi:Pvc16 N-terminal domain
MTWGRVVYVVLEFRRWRHSESSSGEAKNLIHELDQTLAALLSRELPARDQITVSFAAPDDQFSVKLPAVDLFLYDIRENLELRSNDSLIERRDDLTSIRFQPPVRVDASYLITAWPGGGGGDASEDEHKLLSAVMRVLLRYPKLPRELLKGSLANQDLPLPVSTLQPGRLQSLGEFWQALGGKPKAALNYTVTLSVNVSEPESYPVVIDKEIRIRLDTEPSP